MGMKYKLICLVMAILLVMVAGCASRSPVPSSKSTPALTDADENQVGRLIALLPVDNKAGNAWASEILRNELLQKLYFKGYPKIPFSFIDERLAAVASKEALSDIRDLPPQTVGKALGVDALLYATLTEWNTSRALLYGSTEIEVSFVLKSAHNGTTLWQNKNTVKDRHFDITPGRLEAKAHISYDAALRELLEEAMATFPDGPESLKPVALIDTRPWYLRWFRP